MYFYCSVFCCSKNIGDQDVLSYLWYVRFESVFFPCGNIVYVFYVFLIDVMILSIRENVIPFWFCKWGTWVILWISICLVICICGRVTVFMFFLFCEKFVCFLYVFSCYEVGLFFLREVLLYLWHQRSDSVFFP